VHVHARVHGHMAPARPLLHTVRAMLCDNSSLPQRAAVGRVRYPGPLVCHGWIRRQILNDSERWVPAHCDIGLPRINNQALVYWRAGRSVSGTRGHVQITAAHALLRGRAWPCQTLMLS